MPSKLVVDRTANVESVNQAVSTHAAETAARWSDLVSPFLAEGEVLADMQQPLQLIERLLRSRGDLLEEIDQVQMWDRDQLTPLRLNRDAAVAEVTDQLRRIRRVCQGLFGPELASYVVVAEDGVSLRPKLLLRQADYTLARLLRPEGALPGEGLVGVEFNPQQFAASLAPAVETLRTSLEEVERKERQAESSLVAKYAAMDRFDEVYAPAVKMLQGYFTFVGQPGLASRLRPPLRRKRTGEEDPPPPSGGGVPVPSVSVSAS